MMNSLEVRCPMCDQDLVKLVSGIPPQLRIKGRRQKWILKETMLPALGSQISERGKKGFDIPLDRWLWGAGNELVKDALLQSNAIVAEWIDMDYVREMFQSSSRGVFERRILWSVLVLELWAREHLR